MNASWLLSAAILSIVFAGSTPAGAAGLQVSPVSIELTREHANAVIALRNESDAPARYQISVVSWTQEPDGQMKLAPTRRRSKSRWPPRSSSRSTASTT